MFLSKAFVIKNKNKNIVNVEVEMINVDGNRYDFPKVGPCWLNTLFRTEKGAWETLVRHDPEQVIKAISPFYSKMYYNMESRIWTNAVLPGHYKEDKAFDDFVEREIGIKSPVFAIQGDSSLIWFNSRPDPSKEHFISFIVGYYRKMGYEVIEVKVNIEEV